MLTLWMVLTPLHSSVVMFDTKTSGDLGFGDNVKATFGSSNPLEIYHDGTSSYIDSTTPGQYLRLVSSGGIVVQTQSSNNAIVCISNGKTSLYYGRYGEV